MKKRCFLYSLLLLFPFMAMGVEQYGSDFKTTDEILAMAHTEQPTNCASEIFSNALHANAGAVSESTDENVVRVWAKKTMESAEVLQQILQCPEIANVDDNKTIYFTPIIYKFSDAPDARTITINYSTQPKVLKQKLLLANKPSLPNGDVNPKLMDANDPAKYLNTEPAWYGIMVVQHDSLSNFVGPGKNNTVSMKWINDNIDSIYPSGHNCTSKSALTLGNNNDTINRVVHEVVSMEDDSNDYYVAGDVNLEWVMYAEIAADVVLTVATFGGGEAALIGLKGARAFKTGKNLLKSMNNLLKIEDVKKYAEITKTISQHTDDIAKLEKNITNAEKYEKAMKKADQLRKAGKDATKYEKEAQEMLEAAKKIDPKITENVSKMTRTQEKALADINTNITRYEKQIKDLNGKNPSKAKELRTKISDQTNKRNKILNQINAENATEPTKFDPTKLREEQKKLQEIIKKAQGDADKLLKNSDDVKKFKEQADTYKDVHKYFRDLRAFKRPQTGNVITRNLKKIIKTAKAANKGAKTMGKAGRIARAGMSSRSAKIGDWLRDATLKHGARLARFERDMGGIYGMVYLLGEMYDKTSATSKEFSNGIEFKPLCLLSADDLQGQENVVNYGMWLMWTGNSTDPADDDAAYLQAMDFAAKFYYQLDEYQDEHGANCDVDIYVVHPFIRLDETNTDDPHGELFYLFMNEIPWSTAEQA